MYMKLLQISLFTIILTNATIHSTQLQSVYVVNNQHYANFLLNADNALEITHTFDSDKGILSLTCNDLEISEEIYSSLITRLKQLYDKNFINHYEITYENNQLTLQLSINHHDDTVIRIHGNSSKRFMIDFISINYINNKKKRKPRIILDAGHGGHDPGASYEHVNEKEIALAITKKVFKLLKKAGYQVLMTRSDDTFLELSERTAIATDNNVDLFVSIHLNATRLPGFFSHGIEVYHPTPENQETMTYYATNKTTAARSLKTVPSYFESINKNSIQLAQALQKNLITSTITHAYTPHDRGVKQETFRIFWQALFPIALIEAGFISNKTERELLQKNSHQELIARGIFKGIKEIL